MNPGNVKALFRRAQARIGNGKLGEAEQGLLLLLAPRLRMILKMIFLDLDDALRREPKNTTVQQELENIKKLRSSKARHPSIYVGKEHFLNTFRVFIEARESFIQFPSP